MWTYITTHWKTSTAGALLSAFLGFVLFAPQHFPPWLIDVAKFASIGGVAALGLSARDPRRP